MPELTLEFEVFCGKCGAGLCGNCTEGKTRGRGTPFIQVEPCGICMEGAKDAGYDKGYSDGKADEYDRAQEQQA